MLLFCCSLIIFYEVTVGKKWMHSRGYWNILGLGSCIFNPCQNWCAHFSIGDMCPCVCVCVWERERERQCSRPTLYITFILLMTMIQISCVYRGQINILDSWYCNYHKLSWPWSSSESVNYHWGRRRKKEWRQYQLLRLFSWLGLSWRSWCARQQLKCLL